MKKTLCIAVFCAFSLQANAGFWDSLTSIFSPPEPAPTEESKPAKASPAEKTGSITTTTTSTTTSNASSSEVSISSSVSLDANTAAAANQTATSSMIQTGIQLLPLLSQTLGVSTSQATGGMGALLQTAQSLLSGNDFNVIANAIPGANDLLSAAPAVNAVINGGMLDGAMKMVTDSNPSLKAGAQLVSQFKSLGMGAEMIPKFSDVGSNYLKQNGNAEASILLDAAISGAL
ncbi:hypothetical protein HNQ57_001428 [Zhongshania antarctica]|uniref:DUF2780 domain-containing protein n=1 Tax=Zhongshania antarctica TaxID=641702 RepID=A0A840R278_9GAMM|nr:DUF2780 domain-containing protein [Zhongshania antarctica]MBB5187165.1 hypothetical protein [Zhongshania antarctica]